MNETRTLNVNATEDKPYAVLHWCSHPDLDNDDCNTGDSFATKDEALVFFAENGSFEIEYIEIDGPDIHEVRKNPSFSKKQVKFNDDLDRSEYAHQQGMAFGCDGYNEAMGYD